MIATHWLSVYAMTLGIALSGGCAVAQSRRPASAMTTPFDKIATFSIVAVDPVSGVCGAAVASKYPAVAKVVPFVKGGVGAFCTQHFHHPEFGDRALGLLTAGKAPQDVLAELLRDDEGAGGRQLAIIDRAGRTAQHNPDTAGLGSRWWGAASGRFYACQGNTLVGPQVITAMAAAYEDTTGSLADRLMAALVAGDCAGGDHRGRLAAGIIVDKPDHDGMWFELYVDDSDDAVLELTKKYVAVDHAAKGDWPGGNPPWAHPCADRPDPEAPRE